MFMFAERSFPVWHMQIKSVGSSDGVDTLLTNLRKGLQLAGNSAV